jgi:hypothetical protein
LDEEREALAVLLDEAMAALDVCFKSLGSSKADIAEMLSPELYVRWQARTRIIGTATIRA